MNVFPRVVFDESHSNAWSLEPEVAARINPAQSADASYALAAEALRSRGFEVVAHEQGALGEALTPGDVLVIAHPAAAGSERSSGTGSPVLAPEELDAVEEFVRAGGAAIVVSSEAPELLHLSDRIAVFKGGRLVTISTDTALSQEALLSLAS